MSTPVDRQSSTKILCGEFVEPATRDPGRDISAPIKPTCAASAFDADGDSVLVYVDGVPTFSQI